MSESDNPVVPLHHGWGSNGDALAELFGPVSPEIALVSPELAKLARALLPERPWEQFAPPAARLERPTRVAAGASPPADGPASATSLVPSTVPALEHTEPASSRRRVSVGLVTWAAIATLVLISTLPIVRDAPSLGEASPTVDGGGSSDRGNPEAKPPATPPPTGAADGVGTTAIAPDVYSGAYLTDGLRLEFDASTSRVLSLTVSGLCARRTMIRDIPVSEDGSFATERRVGGSTVSAHGRFRPPGLVTGTVSVERASCGVRSRSFAARIS